MKYLDIVPVGTKFCFDIASSHEAAKVDLHELANKEMTEAAGIWWKVLNCCSSIDDPVATGFDNAIEMKNAREKLLELFDKLVVSIGGGFAEKSIGVEKLRWVMDVRESQKQ